MMRKYLKSFIALLVVAVIIPQMALAAWWNPFSWGWINRIFHFQQTVQKPESAIKVSLSDDQIAEAVFPSSKWEKFQPSKAPNQTTTFGYKPKGQTGELPFNWIDLVKKGDANKDGREDALVRTGFVGADSATSINFVLNKESGAASLEFPVNRENLGVDFEAGKIYIKDFGFTNNGFYVTYSGNFSDVYQTISYKIANDKITEAARSKVLTSDNKTLDQVCTEGGGKVNTVDCYCSGTKDFYNTCAIGACTCMPDPKNKVKVKTCDCGEGKCWQGNQCVSFTKDKDGNVIISEAVGSKNDVLSGWKTYANAEYGFEIKYPLDQVFDTPQAQGVRSFYRDALYKEIYITTLKAGCDLYIYPNIDNKFLSEIKSDEVVKNYQLSILQNSNGKKYYIGYRSASSAVSIKECASVLNQILSTFKFTK